MRLWDLRIPDCQGLLKCPGVPTAVFDEQASSCAVYEASHPGPELSLSLVQGIVFCVATDAGILKLYDARQHKQGPFITFTVR